jgi:phosphoribosylanthranilate isomerase
MNFDWSVAAALSEQGYKFILAGGLTPANLPRAIDLTVPWAVDVSSGVETDGEKDSDKIRAFISIAHAKKLSDV